MIQKKFLLFVMLILVLGFKYYFNEKSKTSNNLERKIPNLNDEIDSNTILEKSFALNRHLLSITKQAKSHRHMTAVMSQEETTSASNHNTTKALCYSPDIEQFPKGIFDQSDRLKGAVVIHFLVALYMFVGLAIVCDEYFVPSLSSICKFLNLKEDVAGEILFI